MIMELGDDVTYHMKGVGSISFQMSSVMFLSWTLFRFFLF
jgi:hypothetical protein